MAGTLAAVWARIGALETRVGPSSSVWTTSTRPSFYGPDIANELIREALHPYSDDLVLVSKVGAFRDEKGAGLPGHLRSAVEHNLRPLGVDRLGAVNLRLMDERPLFDDQHVSLEDQLRSASSWSTAPAFACAVNAGCGGKVRDSVSGLVNADAAPGSVLGLLVEIRTPRGRSGRAS